MSFRFLQISKKKENSASICYYSMTKFLNLPLTQEESCHVKIICRRGIGKSHWPCFHSIQCWKKVWWKYHAKFKFKNSYVNYLWCTLDFYKTRFSKLRITIILGTIFDSFLAHFDLFSTWFNQIRKTSCKSYRENECSFISS